MSLRFLTTALIFVVACIFLGCVLFGCNPGEPAPPADNCGPYGCHRRPFVRCDHPGCDPFRCAGCRYGDGSECTCHACLAHYRTRPDHHRFSIEIHRSR